MIHRRAMLSENGENVLNFGTTSSANSGRWCAGQHQTEMRLSLSEN